MLRKRLLALLLCPILLLSLPAGCASGMEIEGNLVIELEGNPTTGYTWVYAMSHSGILEEVTNEYQPVSHSDQLVGSGGTFRFEFMPVAAGEVVLQFYYLRTFQENSTIDTRTYVVSVSEHLIITLYEADPDKLISSSDAVVSDSTVSDSSVSDSSLADDLGITAGDTYISTVVFGETTEDIEFTWTLCDSGLYIGVDNEHIICSSTDAGDRFDPVSNSDEEPMIGTFMNIRRYTDSALTAAELTDLLPENSIFSEFSTSPAVVGGFDAVCSVCSADTGISGKYYYVDVNDDVVEISIFYEGEKADDLGARFDAMVESVTFLDKPAVK